MFFFYVFKIDGQKKSTPDRSKTTWNTNMGISILASHPQGHVLIERRSPINGRSVLRPLFVDGGSNFQDIP